MRTPRTSRVTANSLGKLTPVDPKGGSDSAQAEQVRQLVFPFIGMDSPPDEAKTAEAVFEVLTTPGIPALVPWGSGPGLP